MNTGTTHPLIKRHGPLLVAALPWFWAAVSWVLLESVPSFAFSLLLSGVAVAVMAAAGLLLFGCVTGFRRKGGQLAAAIGLCLLLPVALAAGGPATAVQLTAALPPLAALWWAAIRFSLR